MSVEAVPSPTDAPAPPVAAESEIVALLKEQNALLRELLAATRPDSTLLDPKWDKVKEIARRIQPTEDVRFVAVDPTTGAYATGRTAREASQGLGAPGDRTCVIGAGGKPIRIGTLRPGSR